MGDVIHDDNGKTYEVGESTPALRVMTIELRHRSEAQTYHNQVYECMIGGPTEAQMLDDAFLDVDEDGVQDTKRNRSRHRLSLLAFSPLLDKFIRKLGQTEELRPYIKGHLSGEDRGFSVFWAATCEQRNTEKIPATRAAQAAYLAKDSPRLRYLVRIMDTMGAFDEPASGPALKDPPRFFILCKWPLSLWLVEMFICAMGIQYRRIHPGLLPQQRVDIMASFNTPKSKATVLLTTYSCGSLGLNDHLVFSNMVLMEPDQHINGQFHAIDRIHRIGQTNPQRVWILFMEHTINRYIDYKNIEKILPQIAGEQHQSFAVKLKELRQSRRSDLPECESDLSLDDASTASDREDDSDAQRQEDIRQLAYDFLCRPDKLGMEPGCAVRDSRYGNLFDLDTEDVEADDVETGDTETEKLEADDMQTEDAETGDVETEDVETEDIEADEVEDPLQHRIYVISRRTPINSVTRAKKSEREHGTQQKRKFDEDFGHEGPASKHQKVDTSQGL
ncbi:uncharacterized protein N7496_009698 [Penicillium cataractarum]|uniref:Helicase C-terminal domain-containing protein n=1 Tax=Penicillium cataractarum TaxID=2100454 RepID=A0A9W9V2E1_9EURO|nr:uncharacterized protein N7496_009698 [Penicillium cataractarum]KAJ5363985.1 hypothetical protein N7496_009698 [Penicillium cataractarum]